MNANANYSGLKAIGELTEVIDRSQPNNEEAGTLLKRMDSIIVDIESRFTLALGSAGTHHIANSSNFSVSK